jgi:ornithine carbamoyltransferase
MTVDLHGRSLCKETDLTKKEFLHLVDLAAELRHQKWEQREKRHMKRRNVALIFEKVSTRTRSAFEVGAHDQGAAVTYFGPGDTHLGEGETVKDTARVLGRMFDGIEYRGFAQATVEALARHAGVPVWNGLTDRWHPTQMLADILTMRDHSNKRVEEISFCYLGDARNNTANSLLVTGRCSAWTSVSPHRWRCFRRQRYGPSPQGWPARRALGSASSRTWRLRSTGSTSSTPTYGCRWASQTRPGPHG